MSTSAQSSELKEKVIVNWLFSVFSEERSGSVLISCVYQERLEDVSTTEGGEGSTPNRERKHSGVCSTQLFGVSAD